MEKDERWGEENVELLLGKIIHKTNAV